MPILCSTGALIGRPNKRDFRALGYVKDKLSCDGFELMMYTDWYPKKNELVGFINGLNVNIPVLHCDKHIGEFLASGDKSDLKKAAEMFTVNCEIAKSIGVEKLVLHLWNGPVSDSRFENNISGYATLKRIADEHSLLLLVENVVCNVLSPSIRLKELWNKYHDVNFVFDTKMAAFHFQENDLYADGFDWLRQGIRHYHANDYKGGYMDWGNLKTLRIGEGQIDFDRFFSYIRENHQENFTFTVEGTAFDSQGVVHTELLNESFSKIRKHLEGG